MSFVIHYNLIALGAMATFYVTYGSIFAPIRKWEILKCPMCLGFWVGCILAFWAGHFNLSINMYSVAFNGLATGVASMVLYGAIDRLMQE